MMVAERTALDRVAVDIERLTRTRATGEPLALGTRVDDGRQRVLLPSDAAPGERIDIAARSVIDVPQELASSIAMLLPSVATALRAWDRVRPELGTAAVITPGPWAPLLAVVASWYGATPMIVGGDPTSVGGADADAVSSLAKTLSTCPSVCAAELTGRADMVDLLLESIPKYTRVLFAGPRGDRFTIDYYVNVHRKGLQFSSAVLSAHDAFTDDTGRDLVVRASRLLANPVRAARCQAAEKSVE